MRIREHDSLARLSHLIRKLTTGFAKTKILAFKIAIIPMKASALLALIQLMLIGILVLVSGACVKYYQVEWNGMPLPMLLEKMTASWPWLVAISLGWFTYALMAESRLQDRKWRHLLPLSIGLILVGFVFILIIGVTWVTFFPSGPQPLSP